MKYLFILLLVVLFACENSPRTSQTPVVQTKDYTQRTVDSFNALKSPVILIGARISCGSYSIVVKDSTDKVEYYGNMSVFADIIGTSRCIGDTLK